MSKNPRKTTPKEHMEWIRANNYTVADIDKFWADNYGTNPVITNLTDHGMSWRDMNIAVLKQLPTQKERDAEYKRKQEEEQRIAEEAARKEAEEKKYYAEHFAEIMLDKITKGEKLTETELQELVWDYEIEKIYGEDHRWTKEVCSIIELCGKHFAIDWMKGLTEMQDNEFHEQPYPVRQIERIVVTKEWVSIE